MQSVFSHGLSGAILQGPPLRPGVQCCPPPSLWLEWGANHLPPLPTLSFQRIDADTAGQPRRSDTRLGNRPQGLSAARRRSGGMAPVDLTASPGSRPCLEQNDFPFEHLPQTPPAIPNSCSGVLVRTLDSPWLPLSMVESLHAVQLHGAGHDPAATWAAVTSQPASRCHGGRCSLTWLPTGRQGRKWKKWTHNDEQWEPQGRISKAMFMVALNSFNGKTAL